MFHMHFQLILLACVAAQCTSSIEKKLINVEIDVIPSGPSPNLPNLGKIKIIDGCKFQTIGLNIPNQSTAIWLAAKTGQLETYRLSDTPVTNSKNDAEYTIKGAFDDFDEIRLFDPNEGRLMGIAKMQSDQLNSAKNGFEKISLTVASLVAVFGFMNSL